MTAVTKTWWPNWLSAFQRTRRNGKTRAPVTPAGGSPAGHDATQLATYVWVGQGLLAVVALSLDAVVVCPPPTTSLPSMPALRCPASPIGAR